MANISWDSTSISNYFSNSLGSLKNTSCSPIYNNIGDYGLIKSGSYKKLMGAYYDKLEKDNASETEQTSSNDKTSTKKNSKNDSVQDSRKLASDTSQSKGIGNFISGVNFDTTI